LLEVSSLSLKYIIKTQSLEICWARTFSSENYYWDWCKVQPVVETYDFQMMEILHGEVG